MGEAEFVAHVNITFDLGMHPQRYVLSCWHEGDLVEAIAGDLVGDETFDDLALMLRHELVQLYVAARWWR